MIEFGPMAIAQEGHQLASLPVTVSLQNCALIWYRVELTFQVGGGIHTRPLRHRLEHVFHISHLGNIYI